MSESAPDLKTIGQLQHAAKAAEAKSLYKGSIIKAKLLKEDNWRSSNSRKLVHFVRHGQGYHNLLGQVSRDYGAVFSETGDFELAVKEQCPYMLPAIQDPSLTAIGREDAKGIRSRGNTIKPELLVTSPMRRAAETILVGFPNVSVPIVAHEGCREQLGVFICDKRSDLTDYKEDGRYSMIDYNLIESNEDTLWQETKRETMLEMAYRAEAFLHWLRDRPERDIVVGTHSAWLMAVFNVVLDVDSSASSVEEAEHLHSMFSTGEVRSVLLDW